MSSPDRFEIAEAGDPVTVCPSRVIALDGTPVRDSEHQVAVEVAVQIVLGNTPFAVMMLTPGDLVDFAYGFCLTEGVIDTAADIRGARLDRSAEGLRLAVDIVGDKLHRHLSRQRAMTGRTGCGVCGIDDIAALRRARSRSDESRLGSVTVPAIARALAALEQGQTLNRETRAVHGAAWAGVSGELMFVREDVGRHNALDKLLGASLRAGIDPGSGFALVTSRCSFEMVEKAATFGARMIVAISAPTSFAIDRAWALDVTLVAIARRDTLTVFTGMDRIETCRR